MEPDQQIEMRRTIYKDIWPRKEHYSNTVVSNNIQNSILAQIRSINQKFFNHPFPNKGSLYAGRFFGITARKLVFIPIFS